MTLLEKLNKILDIKNNIKTSIATKSGKDVTTDFSTYPGLIDAITTGGSSGPYPMPTNLAYAYTTHNIPDNYYWDNTTVYKIYNYEFYNTRNISKFPINMVSGDNTFENSFRGAIIPSNSNLKDCTIDCSNATNLVGTFASISRTITSDDDILIPHLKNTDKVENFQTLFQSTKLTKSDINRFNSEVNFDSANNINYFFNSANTYNGELPNMKFITKSTDYTSARGCFLYCNLNKINDISCNFIDLQILFSSSSYLQSIGNLDFDKTAMLYNGATSSRLYQMFMDCTLLKSIGNISIPNYDGFIKNSISDSGFYFNTCTALTTIGDINMPKVTCLYDYFLPPNIVTVGTLTVDSLKYIDTDNFKNDSTTYNSTLKKITFKNLGTPSDASNYYLVFNKWGMNENIDPIQDTIPTVQSTVECQSVINSLVTNTFDRKNAGYTNSNIYLSGNTYKLLSTDQITSITNKGYNVLTIDTGTSYEYPYTFYTLNISATALDLSDLGTVTYTINCGSQTKQTTFTTQYIKKATSLNITATTSNTNLSNYVIDPCTLTMNSDNTVALVFKPNLITFSTVDELNAYKYSWDGMLAFVGTTKYKYNGTSWFVNTAYELPYLYHKGNYTNQIDTNFELPVDSKIEIEFNTIPKNTWPYLFSTGQTEFFTGVSSMPSINYTWSGTSTWKNYVSGDQYYNAKIKAVIQSNICNLYNSSGTLLGTINKSDSAPTAANLILFGNPNFREEHSYWNGKLYSFKIYDSTGTTLLQNFVPYINENGEYGLLEKVSNTFFVDKGGCCDDTINNITLLKSITYKASNYATISDRPYINLDYYGNEKANYRYTGEPFDSVVNDGGLVTERFEGNTNYYGDDDNNDYRIFKYYDNMCYDFNSTRRSYTGISNIDTFEDSYFSTTGVGYVGADSFVNELNYYSSIDSSFTRTRPLTMFGGLAGATLYSFQIYEYAEGESQYYQGTLVRNYIPAKQGDNIGLYETINKKFYYPTNTTNKLVGTEFTE